MRLALVISMLGPGGAERQLSGMANYWAGKGWPVTLATLFSPAAEPSYRLDPNITYLPLRVLGSAQSLAAAVRESGRAVAAMRRAIKSTAPNAVISFIDQVNILTLATTRGLDIPVIVSERTDPRHHKIGRRWQFLRRLLYPAATKIVVQREEYREGLPAAARARCVVIPNFVSPPSNRPSRIPSGGALKILAIGRLSWEKGFDLLIRAFARLAHDFEGWSLEVWGEGPMRQQLQDLARTEGVGDRVRFPGLSSCPEEQFAQAEMFVLPSRYEGFPNVLLEAMAAGLPVVSFAGPAGPNAIIRHGVDGILVSPEDVVALSDAMRRLMESEVERQRLAARAPEVLTRFSQESVMAQWENLLSPYKAEMQRRP